MMNNSTSSLPPLPNPFNMFSITMRDALESDDAQGTFSDSHHMRNLPAAWNSPSTNSSFAMEEDRPQDFLSALDTIPSLPPGALGFEAMDSDETGEIITCTCGAFYLDLGSCQYCVRMQRLQASLLAQKQFFGFDTLGNDQGISNALRLYSDIQHFTPEIAKPDVFLTSSPVLGDPFVQYGQYLQVQKTPADFVNPSLLYSPSLSAFSSPSPSPSPSPEGLAVTHVDPAQIMMGPGPTTEEIYFNRHGSPHDLLDFSREVSMVMAAEGEFDLIQSDIVSSINALHMSTPAPELSVTEVKEEDMEMEPVYLEPPVAVEAPAPPVPVLAPVPTPALAPALAAGPKQTRKSPPKTPGKTKGSKGVLKQVLLQAREVLPRSAKVNVTWKEDEDEYENEDESESESEAPAPAPRRKGKKAKKNKSPTGEVHYCNILHEDSDGRKVYCDRTFGRINDCYRHMENIHGITRDLKPDPILTKKSRRAEEQKRCKTCNHNFSRRDAVKRHRRKGCTGRINIRRPCTFFPPVLGPDGLAVRSKMVMRVIEAPQAV